MDFASIAGVGVAVGCILVGQALEGGHVGSILQATAALIVFGGTIGAVCVAFPGADLKRGLKLARGVFVGRRDDPEGVVRSLVELANVARRDGLLALEQRLPGITDPFLRRAVGFLIDGVDAQVTRDALEAEIHAQHTRDSAAAKVFESAGGFSPTIGILGAVLGLIHVMENLSDPSKLGAGIATAFVATVYGVGAANLLFLPMAGKLKLRLAAEREQRTMVMEGVLAIQAGMNPRVLEEKLRAYTAGEAPALAAAH